MSQSFTGDAGGIGWWLFRRRTLIPLPLALAVLLLPDSFQQGPSTLPLFGIALVIVGEGIRLWGVRHIGVVSRTRSDRLGPLVASGPFAIVRNPLYLGNIALWAGFALTARLPWLAPLFVVILAAEYHAIVLWEERLLSERLGHPYRDYLTRVPRWLPRLLGSSVTSPRDRPQDGVAAPPFSWRETFFSERGTLIAIGVGFVLLWLKA